MSISGSVTRPPPGEFFINAHFRHYPNFGRDSSFPRDRIACELLRYLRAIGDKNTLINVRDGVTEGWTYPFSALTHPCRQGG